MVCLLCWELVAVNCCCVSPNHRCCTRVQVKKLRGPLSIIFYGSTFFDCSILFDGIGNLADRITLSLLSFSSISLAVFQLSLGTLPLKRTISPQFDTAGDKTIQAFSEVRVLSRRLVKYCLLQIPHNSLNSFCPVF